MDPYQSVIIIAVIAPAQIVIVALVQNMRAPQKVHQTQNIIVSETHDEKLLNIDSIIYNIYNNMPNNLNNNV